jgi:hypothetical protein
MLENRIDIASTAVTHIGRLLDPARKSKPAKECACPTLEKEIFKNAPRTKKKNKENDAHRQIRT